MFSKKNYCTNLVTEPLTRWTISEDMINTACKGLPVPLACCQGGTLLCYLCFGRIQVWFWRWEEVGIRKNHGGVSLPVLVTQSLMLYCRGSSPDCLDLLQGCCWASLHSLLSISKCWAIVLLLQWICSCGSPLLCQTATACPVAPFLHSPCRTAVSCDLPVVPVLEVWWPNLFYGSPGSLAPISSTIGPR